MRAAFSFRAARQEDGWHMGDVRRRSGGRVSRPGTHWTTLLLLRMVLGNGFRHAAESGGNPGLYAWTSGDAQAWVGMFFRTLYHRLL